MYSSILVFMSYILSKDHVSLVCKQRMDRCKH